jgi:hypothetical protein
VDSLLLELEDNRQSLLLVGNNNNNSSNKAPINVESPAVVVPVAKQPPALPPKTSDVLGDADRILYALSMHGVTPLVASGAPPNVNVVAPAPAPAPTAETDDAEFDSLLSALEEPATVVAQQQSAVKRQPSNNYGTLPKQQHQKPPPTAADDDDELAADSPYKELPTKQEIFGVQSTGYDAGDDELGSLISELEPAAVAASTDKPDTSAEQTRILKNVSNVREAFEAAIGDTVFAAQEQTGSLDNSILELSSACRTFVGTVREERRVFDNESVQRINESLLVVSKGTKGLAMAAQAYGSVATAQQKMDGILEILQKQLDKIYGIFQECVKAL